MNLRKSHRSYEYCKASDFTGVGVSYSVAVAKVLGWKPEDSEFLSFFRRESQIDDFGSNLPHKVDVVRERKDFLRLELHKIKTGWIAQNKGRLWT